MIADMCKKIRISLVRELIELMEKFAFNRKLIKFYKSQFGNKINLVIDVGANTGQSIDLFLKLNPHCKIMAFEPNPRLFHLLEMKYAGNSNIHLFQFGVSDEVGQKVFNENVLHSTSTFEELNLASKHLEMKSKVLGVKPRELVRERYSVEVTTLSYFINNIMKSTDPIDILKIDTEGHEYSCLVGLFENQQHFDIKYIQLENHKDDIYLTSKSFEDMVEILSEKGFGVDLKVKHNFGDFEDVIFKNKNI